MYRDEDSWKDRKDSDMCVVCKIRIGAEVVIGERKQEA